MKDRGVPQGGAMRGREQNTRLEVGQRMHKFVFLPCLISKKSLPLVLAASTLEVEHYMRQLE